MSVFLGQQILLSVEWLFTRYSKSLLLAEMRAASWASQFVLLGCGGCRIPSSELCLCPVPAGYLSVMKCSCCAQFCKRFWITKVIQKSYSVLLSQVYLPFWVYVLSFSLTDDVVWGYCHTCAIRSFQLVFSSRSGRTCCLSHSPSSFLWSLRNSCQSETEKAPQ